jgi:hypothetical protein
MTVAGVVPTQSAPLNSKRHRTARASLFQKESALARCYQTREASPQPLRGNVEAMIGYGIAEAGLLIKNPATGKPMT